MEEPGTKELVKETTPKELAKETAPQLSCSSCLTTFSSTAEVKDHYKKVHNKDRYFTCMICSKTFWRNVALNAHIRSVHNDLRPHSCTICSSSFHFLKNLNRHIKTIHEREKNFLCQECPKRFGQKATLVVHIKGVHRKERPHKCSQCDKSFLTAQLLKGHTKLVHEGQRNFLCHLCPGKFSNKQNVTRHLETVHSELKQFKLKTEPKPKVRRQRNRNRNKDCTQYSGGNVQETQNESAESHSEPEDQVTAQNITTEPDRVANSAENFVNVDIKSEAVHNFPGHVVYLEEPASKPKSTQEVINELDKNTRHRICRFFKNYDKKAYPGIISNYYLTLNELTSIVVSAEKAGLKTTDFIEAVVSSAPFQKQ
jgi:predicted translin family RNA/ssDNA-binding protein